MTETSPIVTIADVPADVTTTDQQRKLNSTGRFLFGAKGRIVDEAGTVLPRDGRSVGEVQVCGPWITGGYHGGVDAESFSIDPDGQPWLHTGDIGHISADGYLTLTDRAKDVIKSGGEWISSVHLETTLVGHPDVVEAAVVGVPDTRWDERPLALVTLRPGSAVRVEDLKAWLAERVQRWWLPERWAVVGAIARTGVGKYDKKLIRQRYQSGEIPVTLLPR
jgi:fatty-acyl-CoA synthase